MTFLPEEIVDIFSEAVSTRFKRHQNEIYSAENVSAEFKFHDSFSRS
jgi:hypothetical protein